nr:MAG TPA_asm: hypothetical protein [Caudoviricetes sp.]
MYYTLTTGNSGLNHLILQFKVFLIKLSLYLTKIKNSHIIDI